MITRLLTVCVCFFIFALLRYPAALTEAAAGAFSLWFSSVLPSLFPFLAAIGILLRMGAAEKLGRLCAPLTKPLFSLSGVCAFPLAAGLLSGYPAGANTVAQLYEQRRISLSEARKVLLFCNAPGPLFVLGTAGTTFFGSPALGYAMLLAVFVGTILSGISYRSIPTDSNNQIPILPAQKKEPFFLLFSSAVKDALLTSAQIGGFLVCFCVLQSGLAQAGFFTLLSKMLSFLPVSPEFLQAFSGGLLEMTKGIHGVSLSPDSLRLRASAAVFLLSFGGFSIFGQILGVLRNVPISPFSLLSAKIRQAFFSVLVFQCFYFLAETQAQKAVPVFSTHTATAFPTLYGLLSVLLLCSLLLERQK